MPIKKEHRAIGIMSGSSLDGLDMACCVFTKKENGLWNYGIEASKYLEYPEFWRQRLATLPQASALEFSKTHIDFGQYIAEAILDFMAEDKLMSVDLIGSHGHTVFHQAGEGITTQIGAGGVIASLCRIPTIVDFRLQDVVLGGQGAPLVGLGDELLFSDYDACLNLGGICNLTHLKPSRSISFDIAPCNMALNALSKQKDLPYDKDGELARSGAANAELLDTLNAIPFYNETAPKSLAKEWYDAHFHPFLQTSSLSVEDLLCTVVEHIAIQINRCIENANNFRVLVTGGGAFNHFLMERIRTRGSAQFEVPDEETVNFKEAIVFAFLGLLRYTNHINCLSKYTGANRDSISGALYLNT